MGDRGHAEGTETEKTLIVTVKGLFITFEGTEGSGKSTQAVLLVDRLRTWGRTVHLFREPEIGRAHV